LLEPDPVRLGAVAGLGDARLELVPALLGLLAVLLRLDELLPERAQERQRLGALFLLAACRLLQLDRLLLELGYLGLSRRIGLVSLFELAREEREGRVLGRELGRQVVNPFCLGA